VIEWAGHAGTPAWVVLLLVVLGALWGWLGWRFGDLAGWAALPAYLLFAWMTVVLVWIDADVHRLPDGIVLPAYPALLVLVALAAGGLGQWSSLWRALACMAGLYAVYFVLAFVSPGSSASSWAGWGCPTSSSVPSPASSSVGWSGWSCASVAGWGCARTSPSGPPCSWGRSSRSRCSTSPRTPTVRARGRVGGSAHAPLVDRW
jgi:hypothetical protein